MRHAAGCRVVAEGMPLVVIQETPGSAVQLASTAIALSSRNPLPRPPKPQIMLLSNGQEPWGDRSFSSNN